MDSGEEFTAWPMIGSEQFTVPPDVIEQGVNWDPEGLVAANDLPRDILQATGVSFPQDHSQFEQGFFQNFDGGLPQTVTPAELHYGFDASAVHHGPFYTSHILQNNPQPFFHHHIELKSQNTATPMVGFSGNYGGFDNKISEFHYDSDVSPNAAEFENLYWAPDQGAEGDDPLNVSMDQSFFHPTERNLGQSEWNVDGEGLDEDGCDEDGVDEDGIDGEQSESPQEITTPTPTLQSTHLIWCGPDTKKKRYEGETVEKRTCKLCEVVLSHSTSLKRHYAQHLSTPQHFTASQILTAENYCGKGKPLTRCKYCPLLSNRPASIAVHERTHAEGINITKCSVCAAVLTSTYIRKEHMKAHKDDLRRTFMRGGYHRSKTTFDKEDDDDFNNTGSDPVEEPAEDEARTLYDCRLCAAGFVSRSFRKRHYSVHRKIDEGGDGQMFMKNLARRVTRDLGGEEDHPDRNPTQVILSRFRCPTCGEGFKTRYFMQKHQVLHYEGEENDMAKKRKLDNSENGDSGKDERIESQQRMVNNGAKRVKGKLVSAESANET